METTEPQFTFPTNVDYPISLALWHWNVNGTETPVSGDQQYHHKLP